MPSSQLDSGAILLPRPIAIAWEEIACASALTPTKTPTKTHLRFSDVLTEVVARCANRARTRHAGTEGAVGSDAVGEPVMVASKKAQSGPAIHVTSQSKASPSKAGNASCR